MAADSRLLVLTTVFRGFHQEPEVQLRHPASKLQLVGLHVVTGPQGLD
ncbi:MAG: hypothetical protein JWQ75_748, partial [Pseudarthrobacter sp.]|nr:hypothetical protein [Pseudarthrobacter sp.]